ncbi:hypothetical protein N7447_007041 [Penicillium robsamsonii]|uniref:uncharacterized protein n=1 Tax=Penicillium robsamsonii TaxID=1792511 RepID=UPI00254719BF|nr:uncharacterized protein N7447_007041 [Penicillium robsamsonii]KAJ5824701.1 hypothetical protein N7447_007041 [Penicillium robsamsonii]
MAPYTGTTLRYRLDPVNRRDSGHIQPPQFSRQVLTPGTTRSTADAHPTVEEHRIAHPTSAKATLITLL